MTRKEEERTLENIVESKVVRKNTRAGMVQLWQASVLRQTANESLCRQRKMHTRKLRETYASLLSQLLL